MTWVRVDDKFAQHPKVVQAGPLAMALQVAGLCYCNRNLTDGFVPWAVAQTLVSWQFLENDGELRRKQMQVAVTCGMAGDDVTTDYVIGLLVDAGLWETRDGGYYIHDYLDFQPSKEEVLAEKASKVAAGRAGGQASAKARAQAKSKPVAQARSPSPSPKPKPEPVPDAAAATTPDIVLANLATTYENEIGALSPGMMQELTDWAGRIPNSSSGEAAIRYAFGEAVANNKRRWRYVRSILERLEVDGWPADPMAQGKQGESAEHRGSKHLLSDAEADWIAERYERGQKRQGKAGTLR